jgi:prepilin-type N-terminal cleavage/methylation domain-containing protein
MTTPSGNKGFTLIETLVVVAILAIGLAIAVPYFREMGLRNASKAQVRALKDALAKARMDAVERNESLTATISATNNRCTVTDTGGATISTTDFDDVQLSVSPNPLAIVWDTKGMTSNAFSIGVSGNGVTYNLIVSAAGNIQITKP